MEEQNKTAEILMIALVVFGGAAMIYLAASKAKASELDTEKKSQFFNPVQQDTKRVANHSCKSITFPFVK
jgi:hypothetical protein